MVRQIQAKFRSLFKDEPILVRSPGRVNLIGEHTDYNEGFVLPAAVDKAIYFAVAPKKGAVGSLHAFDLDQSHEFEIARPVRSDKGWPNYLMGVVDQLGKAGAAVGGFACVFGGDIPIGSGMSSSAAIEAGLAFSLNRIFSLGLDPLKLVKLAQKAENEFVGVRCGIMDQFINIFGRPRSVLKLDCRSLDHQYFPFERADLRIVLCDTLVKRELAASEYNVRRAQCEAGVKILAKHAPGLLSLRDVSLELLEAQRSEFDPIIYKRCDYVVHENLRVEEACSDLKKGDFTAFGRRMNGSHDGLRDDYQVSCRELDVLVEAAGDVPGVLGARMMGAGFGGCTINLVEETAIEALKEGVVKSYKDIFGREPKIYISSLRSGTDIIKI
ncbi:MAG: galactokinase [Candidatus Aminicenantes bacterium]|nr:galactokinase [Candidatus Aminicenantes bacterium]